MVRVEKYKEADEAELSEPGGGAAPVVWRIVCLSVYAGHFGVVGASKNKRCPDMALGQFTRARRRAGNIFVV